MQKGDMTSSLMDDMAAGHIGDSVILGRVSDITDNVLQAFGIAITQ